MVASNIPSPEEALAGMARVGNPRQPMGLSGFGFTSPTAAPSQGTLIPKKGAQSGDPTPPTATRGHGAYPLPAGTGDHDGASYRIVARMPQTTDPSAGQTQANGRIITRPGNRQLPNFSGGASDSRG